MENLKDFIIYSDGSTIRLGKIKARTREIAEKKGRKLYKINVWCREKHGKLKDESVLINNYELNESDVQNDRRI